MGNDVTLKNYIKNFVSYYLPLIFWMGVIFAFSSMSGYSQRGELTLSEWFVRKGAHVGEYTILTFFLFRVVWLHLWRKPAKGFFLTGLFSLIYAVSDEVHQYFVPFRQGKSSDILIDCIGISLSLLFFFVLWRLSQKK